jgi:hypothetical protein
VFLLNQKPLVLGIMTRWQVEQVVWRQNNILVMDSTFCTNKYNVFWFLFPLFTIQALFSMVRIHENLVYSRLFFFFCKLEYCIDSFQKKLQMSVVLLATWSQCPEGKPLHQMSKASLANCPKNSMALVMPLKIN